MTLLFGLGTTQQSETPRVFNKPPGERCLSNLLTVSLTCSLHPLTHRSLPAGMAGFPLGHAGNTDLLSPDAPSQELCQGEQYFKRFSHLTQLFLKKNITNLLIKFIISYSFLENRLQCIKWETGWEEQGKHQQEPLSPLERRKRDRKVLTDIYWGGTQPSKSSPADVDIRPCPSPPPPSQILTHKGKHIRQVPFQSHIYRSR